MPQIITSLYCFYVNVFLLLYYFCIFGRQRKIIKKFQTKSFSENFSLVIMSIKFKYIAEEVKNKIKDDEP